MMKTMIEQTAGLRRPGAAALDLAYVAAGFYDGFWEVGLNPWDVAAGSLLVQEAGGLIGDLAGDGDFLHGGQVIAGQPEDLRADGHDAGALPRGTAAATRAAHAASVAGLIESPLGHRQWGARQPSRRTRLARLPRSVALSLHAFHSPARLPRMIPTPKEPPMRRAPLPAPAALAARMLRSFLGAVLFVAAALAPTQATAGPGLRVMLHPDAAPRGQLPPERLARSSRPWPVRN